MLADPCEQRIAQLVESDLNDADDIVGHNQHHRPCQHGRQQRRGARIAGKRVGRPFEEVGNRNQRQLRRDQQHGRPYHPGLEVGAVRRPHVRPQIDQRFQG
jgi:hypothetical protein